MDQEPEIPRATAGKRHAHRANATATTAEEFYRVNYYYPFVDHVLAHLPSRFPKKMKGALLAYYLMPKKLSKLTVEVKRLLKIVPGGSTYALQLWT